MNAREELAAVVSASLDSIFGTRDFGPAQQDYKLADALIAAGYRKPPTIDNDKLVIDDGMLLLEVGGCTCTPYGSSHEAFCGYEYLDDLTGPLKRAGYVKHRTITTVEELDALPEGSVIRTSGDENKSEPRVAIKSGFWHSESEWFVADDSEWCLSSDELDDLPATVLHEGAQS